MKQRNNLIKKEFELIIQQLSAEEQSLLKKVVQAERNKLYMKTPRGINEDIIKAIIEVIK